MTDAKRTFSGPQRIWLVMKGMGADAPVLFESPSAAEAIRWARRNIGRGIVTRCVYR